MAGNRIPVTITGSLPQTAKRVKVLEAAARGGISQDAAGRVTAVAEAVAWQAGHGIDIVSNGELGRLCFMGAARPGSSGVALPFVPAGVVLAGAPVPAQARETLPRQCRVHRLGHGRPAPGGAVFTSAPGRLGRLPAQVHERAGAPRGTSHLPSFRLESPRPRCKEGHAA